MFSSLITTEQAHEVIQSSLVRLSSESVPIEKAVNRKLAEDLFADRPLPPFDRAMMDGIAFNSKNIMEEGKLTIQGLHAAGNPNPPDLQPGHCWEIMTGACIPNDCDTLIPYEEVTILNQLVTFQFQSAHPGKYIHRSGSDYKQGDLLVPKGSFLGSREMAVAASIGASHVQVLKHPRVHIITTGDELISIDAKPKPHQIRRSNNLALVTALQKIGLTTYHQKHVKDDQVTLQKELKESLENCDLLFICGGISKGKKDYVRSSLQNLVGAPSFHGISQRPGKPFAFWHQNNQSLFALPGNPVSTLVCFHRYVLPYLEQLGLQLSKSFFVNLAEDFEFKAKLTGFIPANIKQEKTSFYAKLHPIQNSGDFATAVGTDGFVELKKDASIFKKGTALRFFPWI